MTENEFMDEPGRIFNIDKIGFQLNNRPEHVVAKDLKILLQLRLLKKGKLFPLSFKEFTFRQLAFLRKK